MPYPEKFKDVIKKRVYIYSLNLIKFLRSIRIHDYCSQTIIKQVIRSGTSIGANIIEGQACGTKKDFIHYINIALKSSNETKFWLAILKDSFQEINKTEIEKLLRETVELSNILASIELKCKGKK